MKNKNISTTALALAATLFSISAQADTYKYQITALDIPIGAAYVSVDNPAGDYKIGMNGKFTGIAAMFGGGKGNINVNGHNVYGVPLPLHAGGNVAWGDKPRTTSVDFIDGNAANINIQPPYNYNPKKRHPLDPTTLTDVVDPFTAIMRPLVEGKLDCTVRPRVFDGKERYDLQFQPTNDPMTCMVNPINVSGYDKKYDNGDQPRPLKITFTPIENGTFAIPQKIVRELMIGKLIIELDQ